MSEDAMRFVGVRVVMPLGLLAALLLGSGESRAESHLFSAHANRDGVTLVGASRNGVNLPVAGQQGPATFFRIDVPNGPVPCQNDLSFMASTGQRVEMSVDLCAANYDVAVAVAGGGAVAPAHVSAPAAPSGGEDQQLAIATDDPDVTITDVFISGEEVAIDQRADPYVAITLPSAVVANGCSQDIGLALSDGRRVARLVDVCQTNFVAVVALAGGPPPSAPPPGLTPVVSAPPAVVEPMPEPEETTMQPEPTPDEPAVASEPAPQPSYVDTMQWSFSSTGEGGALSYAIPETDAGEFSAVCTTGSRAATVVLDRGAPELVPGGSVSVRVTAGVFEKSYTATGSSVSDLDGISHPELKVLSGDAVWAALIRERAVSFTVGSSPTYSLSLAGSAEKVKQFLAVCSPPPLVEVAPQAGGALLPLSGPAVLLPVPPDAVGGAVGGETFACRDGGSISIDFGRNTAMVTDSDGRSLRLYRSGSPYGPRYTSGLSELIVQGGGVAYWTREGRPQRICSPN